MSSILKYGAYWKSEEHPLEIERTCIRKGGYWLNSKGVQCGAGMFTHFKNMQTLIWPEDDHHRWSDLILSKIVENRILVVAGSRDSSKTRSVSKWVLCDYWCFPKNSLFLMTSTTAQGLEMRVWGDIKSLFNRATERLQHLEGNVVDAKKGIFTDDITDQAEVRDMRRGVVGIPVMTSEGEFQGMALKNFAGIKQERRRLIGDELQFLSTDYLKVLDSMDKSGQDFKAIFLGNMIADNGKALDRVAEPIDGWQTVDETPKTKIWKNKYNGTTINLCGLDSPNFDPDTKDRYPYLLNQGDINTVAARPGGRDSLEWWSQIMGLRKAGVVSDRVLTIDMIQNNNGFKDCIWNTGPTIKILAIDAGYGGDDCVSTYIECGTEVGDIEVIVFKEQKVIPVLLSTPISPEDQIATAAKADADRYGVPYENVYIEAGMRATLAVSFGRILSPAINAINFGGSATQRPVSNDLFVFDERTQQRRLKMCSEHYSKFVTQLAFDVRMLVESGQARMFPMPAAEEFQKRKWRFVYGDRYELETKLEYKERNQSRSPNFSDSVMIGVFAALKTGFEIKRLKDPNAVTPERDDWLEVEVDKHRKQQRKNELNYS